MESSVGRKTDYLFKPKRSQNWYALFQYPAAMVEAGIAPKRRVEIALGTPCPREARAKAGDHITEHMKRMWAYQNARKGDWKITYAMPLHKPGATFMNDQGEQVVATADDGLLVLSKDGVRRESNIGIVEITQAFDPNWGEEKAKPRPEPIREDHPDLAILNTWIAHNAVRAVVAREAKAVLDLFHSLTGKTFATAKRADGRALANHLFAIGNKSSTVTKKVGFLRAACNIAVADDILVKNPFTNVVRSVDDEEDRVPLSDEDMAVMHANLDKLGDDERLLWVLLSTTGMRRGEAWDIESEFTEKGLRCIRIGTKTLQSDRRIPIPEAALPYLPKPIAGPLFADTPSNVGKRLIRRMRAFGITDESKVLHSLRHRAQDKLRAVDCPQDIRFALLGHEKVTVANNYGDGFAMTVLKPWVNEIGLK
jgi:integrase